MSVFKNVFITFLVSASYTFAVPAVPYAGMAIAERTLYPEMGWTSQAATIKICGCKQVPSDVDSASGITATVQFAGSESSSSAFSQPALQSSSNGTRSGLLAAATVFASNSNMALSSSPSSAGHVIQSSPYSTLTRWSSGSAYSSSAFNPSTTPSSQSLGACQGQGSDCIGDITHWDGNMGACGWNVNTNSDMQIALPFAMMGTQSNGNPYCGRSVTIRSTSGTLVRATVGDKCMGCTGYSIDLTNVLFTIVAPDGDGRVSDIQWWFD